MESIVQAILSISKALGGGNGVTGQIVAYGGTAAPFGWFMCDGSAVSRTTYAALFAIVGTTYGVGDGSTTFNLPDLRGKVPVGKNTGTFSVLGATGGEETHVLTVTEMPSHTHQQNLGVPWSTVNNVAGAGIIGNTNNSTTGSAGSGGAHNNIQPYQVINFMVKY